MTVAVIKCASEHDSAGMGCFASEIQRCPMIILTCGCELRIVRECLQEVRQSTLRALMSKSDFCQPFVRAVSLQSRYASREIVYFNSQSINSRTRRLIPNFCLNRGIRSILLSISMYMAAEIPFLVLVLLPLLEKYRFGTAFQVLPVLYCLLSALQYFRN